MLKVGIRISSLCGLMAALVLFNASEATAQIAPTASATISGTVSDSDQRPVEGVRLSLIGVKGAKTQTDSQGRYAFLGVPFGTYTLIAEASAFGIATRSNIAVDADISIAIQFERQRNDLKVIGKTAVAANARFNVTPASITHANPLAQALQGETSWRKILEQIPGVVQAGLQSGGNALAGAPDNPLVPVQVSINGALPYETAVLLDDMPLVGGSPSVGGAAGRGTDLSVYALNSFSSADVIRGPGANSPSVVNSIGGSLRLRVPSAAETNRSDISISNDPYGGIVVNAFGAFRVGHLSTFLSYGFNNSPGPTGGNLPGVRSTSLQPPSTINGNFVDCSIPNCTINNLVLSPKFAPNSFPLTGYSTSLLTCCFNQSLPWAEHGGSVTLGYTISPSITASLSYAGQQASTPVPLPIYPTEFMPTGSYTGRLPIGSYNLSGLGEYTGTGLIAASSLLEEKIIAQIGRGALRLAALQNRTFTSIDQDSLTSGQLQLFGTANICATNNPPCGSPMNPSTAIALNGGSYQVTYPTDHYNSTGRSNNRDLLVSYSTEIGHGARAGLSFVKSYYDSPFNSVLNYAGSAFASAEPSSFSQSTNEYRVFVGGNPSAKTSIDLSGYFVGAHYHLPDPGNSAIDTSTFANATFVDANYSYATPRLGFVWRPDPEIAARLSVGGGIALAPIQNLIGNNLPSNNGTFYFQSASNLNLKPETSFGFDVGGDVRLATDTILSLDLYRTTLHGQFYQSTSSNGTFMGLPLFTQQYGNLGTSRYEGALLDIRHDPQRGLYWFLSAGLTRGYLTSVPRGFYDDPSVPCIDCTNVNVVPNVNFNGQFAASVPYSQAVGTVGHRFNPDTSAGITASYFGNNNTYFRPAFVEFDAQSEIKLTRALSLGVHLRNVTNIYGNSFQTLSASSIGAPAISSLPWIQYGEEYGPRALLITGRLRVK